MSRSTKFTLGLGAIAFAGAGLFYADRLIHADPYQSIRGNHPLGEETGLKMDGVDFKVYDKQQQVLSAYAESIFVRRDRQFYDMNNLFGNTGKETKVNFASEEAKYDAIAKTLTFNRGGKLSNKDMDLWLPQATFDEKSQMVRIPGIAAGTAFGGKVALSEPTYNIPKSELNSKGARFLGKLPATLRDVPLGQGDDDKSAWDFRSDKGAKFSKGTMTFEDVRATDGEVVIRTDYMVRDTKTDVITCTGKVYYYSKKANFVADSAVIDRKAKLATFVGNIRMLVKPKDQPDLTEEIPPFRPDVPETIANSRPAAPSSEETSQQKDLDEAVRSSKTIRKYPALIVAEKVQYWYATGNRKAVITGNPECLQDFPGGRWRRVKGFMGRYDGEADLLRLDSEPGKKNVLVKTSIGDRILATWGEFSVKDDEDDAQDWNLMAPEGTLKIDKDQLPEKPGKKTPEPPAPAPKNSHEEQKTDSNKPGGA